MHFINTIYFSDSSPDLINIEMRGSRFKDQDNALPEGRLCRPEDDAGEHICANRVKIPEIWPYVDDRRSNDDADRV